MRKINIDECGACYCEVISTTKMYDITTRIINYTFLLATKTEMIPVWNLYLYLYMTYHTLTSQSSTEEFAIIMVVYTSVHYIVRLNTIHLSQWLSSSFFIFHLNFDLQNELQNISYLKRSTYLMQQLLKFFGQGLMCSSHSFVTNILLSNSKY